jgi:transketolase
MKYKSSMELAKLIRYQCVYLSYLAKTAHLASSLSCVDLISVLFSNSLKYRLNDLKSDNRNRFILSKGHAATALYSALYYNNIITKKNLYSFTKKNSYFEEHPSPNIPGVEAATGSLGHGLSVACGIAYGLNLKKINKKVFVIMSDGECNEGSVWEAALFASAKKLNNLYCIVDYNKWQATGRTKDILQLGNLSKKFESFGWNSIEINGHNHLEIKNALKKITKIKHKPSIIIANTVKGKGISFMEDDNNWHYRSPNFDELKKSIKELKLNI